MAGVKLPTDELAVKHLVVTKNQHKTILRFARLRNERISVIVNEMIEYYVKAENDKETK